MRPGLRSRLPALVTSICLFAALPACNLATINVRAARAYSNEEADADVVRDRADDVAAALALVEQLVAATPFTPGDPWITALALDDAGAAKIKKTIVHTGPYADGEHEIPVVKLYRLHLTRVLAEARVGARPDPAFPSVLDAMASLAPGGAPLEARWVAFQKALAAVPVVAEATERTKAELLSAIDPIRMVSPLAVVPAAIARDALEVISVADRVALESLALLPTVSAQAARVVDSAGRDLFTTSDHSAVDAVADLPLRAEALKMRADAEHTAMDRAAAALTAITGATLARTAGYALRESIVDQVTGVTLDALRFHANADGEVLFFHQIPVASSGGSKPDPSADDYTGRTRRLEYHMDPIVMVGARFNVAFDWIHLQNAATLNAAFTTDRLFSLGGTIENSSSLASQLGVHGVGSDIIDLGAGLIGIKTRVKLAKFTSGELREIGVDAKTGKDTGLVDKAPLQLAYTQVDVGYDISFLFPEFSGRYWIEELLVGFRYMNYQLPRILYELKATHPGASDTGYGFDRASPAQLMTSRYYMGGASARFGQGEGRTVSLFGDLGFYAGSGPTSYYLLKAGDAPDTAANRDPSSTAVVVIDGSVGLGVRVRLTPKKFRVRIAAEAQYHGELVWQTIISELAETTNKDGTTYTVGKKLDFGGLDVFHGPRLQVVGAF